MAAGTAVLVLAAGNWFVLPGMSGTCRAENLPDPTRPPAVVRQATEDAVIPASERWAVTSILVSPGRRVAIINGQSRQEGETIEGATLVKISPLSVTLREEGRLFNIELGGNRVKKPVAVSGSEAIGR